MAILVAGAIAIKKSDPDESSEEIEDVPPEEVVLPIEDSLDLHSFQPDDVSGVLESYLEAATAAGHREVKIIHGRGIGVQREVVRSLLARHPAVASFADAPPERGGWGATLVLLRPPSSR